MLTRRQALANTAMLFSADALTLPGGAVVRQSHRGGKASERVSDLERRSEGRLGVAVLNTETGAEFSCRADERFPMCSTFKFLAAAAVLARVDRHQDRLDRRIPFSKGDLLEYAPITTARVDEGSMSLAELCEAAITVSDNTAGNLILATIGGPAGFTAYARSLGDAVTRLDRNEPSLNTAIPGDTRDTTTPMAMLGNLKALLLGSALSTSSRDTLTGWLVANKTVTCVQATGISAGRSRRRTSASW